jgi:acetate kinase
VRRYGFHGIAHRFLCQQARALLGTRVAEPRIISLQLGRGCSVTATIVDRPIATSMGFTPLEGLVMGTRSGDFDPGAMLYVMGQTGMTPDAMRRELNENSGLLGLSGRSADMRELLALEDSRDPAAMLAVEVFCRRARHYLGGFLAELGGADAIVFGGGIGENCPDIRRRIAGRLEWAGIRLRSEPAQTGLGATTLHDPASSTAVYVVPVDEGAVIAEEARSVLQRSGRA